MNPPPAMSQSDQETCSHTIPLCLVEQTYASLCVPCFIKWQIQGIKEVQNGLKTRGGVFFSRGTGPKPEAHKSLIGQWQKAKIMLLNSISIIEKLMSENPMENWNDVQEALEEWEKKKESLAKVPGYVYEGEESELSEEIIGIIKRMLEELKNTVAGLLLEDAASTEEAHFEPLPPSPTLSSELKENPESEMLASKTSPPSITPKNDFASSSTSSSNSSLKSILRKSRNTPGCPNTSNSSPTPKQVRTADFATVSPEHLTTSNLSPFLRLSTAEAIQPHRLSTSAEHQRRRSSFNRASTSYLPGPWASPASYSKPNTSFYKLDWKEAHRLWKEEEEEMAEEQRIHDRLRVVAEVWVMNWCLRVIVRHVGLEKALNCAYSGENQKRPEEQSEGDGAT